MTRHFYKEMAIIADALIEKGFEFDGSHFSFKQRSGHVVQVCLSETLCYINKTFLYSYILIKYNEHQSINKILAKVDELLGNKTYITIDYGDCKDYTAITLATRLKDGKIIILDLTTDQETVKKYLNSTLPRIAEKPGYSKISNQTTIDAINENRTDRKQFNTIEELMDLDVLQEKCTKLIEKKPLIEKDKSMLQHITDTIKEANSMKPKKLEWVETNIAGSVFYIATAANFWGNELKYIINNINSVFIGDYAYNRANSFEEAKQIAQRHFDNFVRDLME